MILHQEIYRFLAYIRCFLKSYMRVAGYIARSPIIISSSSSILLHYNLFCDHAKKAGILYELQITTFTSQANILLQKYVVVLLKLNTTRIKQKINKSSFRPLLRLVKCR